MLLFLRSPCISHYYCNDIDGLHCLGGMGNWDKTFPSGLPPRPRQRATASTVGQKILVFGGSVDGEQVDDLALFNTSMQSPLLEYLDIVAKLSKAEILKKRENRNIKGYF